jgi:hypothetical protein
MAKQRYWKIILGSIIAIVCIYCFVRLFLMAKHGWSLARPSVEVPGIGSFKYIGTADSPTIRVKKIDATEVNIMYVNGVCKDKIVLHPKGHPLKGRVRADESTRTYSLKATISVLTHKCPMWRIGDLNGLTIWVMTLSTVAIGCLTSFARICP